MDSLAKGSLGREAPDLAVSMGDGPSNRVFRVMYWMRSSRLCTLASIGLSLARLAAI